MWSWAGEGYGIDTELEDELGSALADMEQAMSLARRLVQEGDKPGAGAGDDVDLTDELAMASRGGDAGEAGVLVVLFAIVECLTYRIFVARALVVCVCRGGLHMCVDLHRVVAVLESPLYLHSLRQAPIVM